MIASRNFALTLVLSAAAATPASAEAIFTVTDLGTLSGNMSWAYGVNDSAVAVGRSKLSIGAAEAFRWENGAIGSLGKLHWSDGGKALGIADNGMIVGTAAIDIGVARAAYALPGGGWQNLNDKLLPGSGWVLIEARDVTEDGFIAGWGTHNGANRAFRIHLDSGAVIDLGTPGTKTVSYGNSIAGGAGQSLVAGDSGATGHGFLWTTMTGMIDLGQIGGVGGYSAACDVSNFVDIGEENYIGGFVVGWAGCGFANGHHATVIYPIDRSLDGMPDTWYEDLDGNGKNDLMRDMGTLASDNWFNKSEALAVSDQGVIVGRSEYDGGGYHAFVSFGDYSGGEMVLHDLNDMIPMGSGWVLQTATDVNNKAQIVGTGLHNGQTRGFLLTLIPEPSTLVLLLAGGLAFVLFARRWGIWN